MEITEQETKLSLICKILSNPGRIRILSILSETSGLTSSEIASKVPLGRTAVIQHIALLRDNHFITSSVSGNRVIFSANIGQIDEYSVIINNFLKFEVVKTDKNKKRILFICTGNSCRSQMAEGFLRFYGRTYNLEVLSAGNKPEKKTNPTAVEVMKEAGIDIGLQYPKSIAEIDNPTEIEMVIFVCSNAERDCPYNFPFTKKIISMPFEDPSIYKGSNKIDKFREIRNQIEEKIKFLLQEFPREK